MTYRRVLAGRLRTRRSPTDMERIQKKVRLHGQVVTVEELEGEPRFVARDNRTGTTRFATRVRYAKNYTVGMAERGVVLAESYGLRVGDVLPGSLVVDCGAHYGDLELWLRETCGDRLSRYVGLEPDAEARACLERNVDRENGHVLPYALSDSSALRTFHVESSTANSSLEETAVPSSATEVLARDLDSVITELGLSGQPIGLLKLEAEGHEPEVLLGATTTLPHVRLIAADLGPERGRESEVTAPFVINHLFEMGFRMKRAGEDRLSLRFVFENTSPASPRLGATED